MGEKLKCPSCGSENEPQEEFCLDCGTALQEKDQTPLPVVQKKKEPEKPPSTVVESPPEMVEQSAGEQPATVEEEAQLETPAPADEPEAPVAEPLVPVVPRFPIQIEVNGATDIGCVRKNNEDAFSITTHTLPSKNIRVDAMVLCDGMGGHAAGESAAFLGVREVVKHFNDAIYDSVLPHMIASDAEFDLLEHLEQKLFLEHKTDPAGRAMNELQLAVSEGNTAVREYGEQLGLKNGEVFGTTIVVVVAIADLSTGNIVIHGWNEGDSRAVWWDGDNLVQLSTDHEIPGFRQLYRFLGQHYTIGGSPFSLRLSASECQEIVLMLYSDGLYNVIAPDPHKTSLELIEMAKTSEPVVNQTLMPDEKRRLPGYDNVTVIRWAVIKPAPVAEPEPPKFSLGTETLETVEETTFIELPQAPTTEEYYDAELELEDLKSSSRSQGLRGTFKKLFSRKGEN